MYFNFKEFTREKRGKGVRRNWSGQAKFPGNWMNFLHKEIKLSTFLISKVSEFTFILIHAIYAALGEPVVYTANTKM